MNIDIQNVIIVLVLAGCVYFLVRSFRKSANKSKGGCCACALKDSCGASTAKNSPRSARQCKQPDQQKQ